MIPIKEVLENYLADLIKEQQRIKEIVGFLLVDKVNYNNVYLQIKTINEMQEVINYLVKEIENEN